MASGGWGIAKYLKRSMDRSHDFVGRKRLKPESFDDKVKKKREFFLHLKKGKYYVKDKTVDWFAIIGAYFLILILTTIIFPISAEYLKANQSKILFGDKIFCIIEVIEPYYSFIPWMIFAFILLYFVFKNLYFAWANVPVEIDQKMKEVKLKTKKRRFRKPAFISDRKNSSEPIPDNS